MKQIKPFNAEKSRVLAGIPDAYVVCDNQSVKKFEVITYCNPIDMFLEVSFIDSDEDDCLSLLPYSGAEDGFSPLVPVVTPLDNVIVILVHPN